jgi:hypothetical protein
LVEHQLWELAVAGSNPVAPTTFFPSASSIIRRVIHRTRLAIILFRAQKETEFIAILNVVLFF